MLRVYLSKHGFVLKTVSKFLSEFFVVSDFLITPAECLTHLEPISVVYEIEVDWLVCKLRIYRNFIRLPVLQRVSLVEPPHLYVCGMCDDVLIFNY